MEEWGRGEWWRGLGALANLFCHVLTSIDVEGSVMFQTACNKPTVLVVAVSRSEQESIMVVGQETRSCSITTFHTWTSTVECFSMTMPDYMLHVLGVFAASRPYVCVHVSGGFPEILFRNTRTLGLPVLLLNFENECWVVFCLFFKEYIWPRYDWHNPSPRLTH